MKREKGKGWMKVAYTYNMKRGDSEEAQDPPGSIVEAQAEWDDTDTIQAASSKPTG